MLCGMDEPTPIDYPKITIDGVAYPVAFSNDLWYYRLDKAGIPVSQVAAKMAAKEVGVSLMYDMLAAAIGHGFTGEKLAEKLPIAKASALFVDAIKKVQPAAQVALREPAASELPQ